MAPARWERVTVAGNAHGGVAGSGGAAPAPRGPRPDAAAEREARKTLARVERALDRIHAQEARLHEQMARAATDPDRLAALTAELADLTDQEARLEKEWMEVSEVLED